MMLLNRWWARARGTPGEAPPAASRRAMGPYVRIVYLKELLEALRDRRTLLVTILFRAGIMPAAPLGIPYLEQRQARQLRTSIPSVAIVGEASALVPLAYTAKLIRPVTTSDPVRALRERRVLAVLRLPAGMEAALARD